MESTRDFLYYSSSCIYPKNSKIPIKEDYIMTGKLEKIKKLMLCQNYMVLSLAQFYTRN